MAGETKDLEYYLTNPDEIPTDLETLSQMAGEEVEGGASGEEVEPPPAQSKATEQPEGAAAVEKKESVQEEAAGTSEEEAPIATRDGKKTIPYTVLATERERRQAAERVAQDLANQIEQLQQQAASGTQTPAQAAAVADLLADEDLAEVVKDFPAVQKLIDAVGALSTQVSDANTQLQAAREREAERQRDELDRIRRDTQAVVEGIPKLLYIQQERPELWEAAIEADSQLRGLPATKGLSMAERFEKAVAIVETIYGDIEVPAKYLPEKVSTSQQKSVADKVQEALAQVGDISKPKTISELPGGATPSVDPLDDIATQSAAALGNQLMGMTPDAISRLLARVA